MTNLQAVQIAVAICREEVEAKIGGTLSVMDDGSVWGRAFLRASVAIRVEPPDTPCRGCERPEEFPCTCGPGEGE